MIPVVTLDADTVTAQPGGQANVTVRVRNPSTVVEGYAVDVLGDAAPWAQVLPGRLEVLPQGEGRVTIVFAPPAGVAGRAGAVPFAVRVVSQIDPRGSAVAEGDLHVGAVSHTQITLTPATSKGRWSARHRVEISNWGNTSVRLALEASDPDEALGFLVTPAVVDLPLGTSRTVRLKVRARRPFMRGMPLRRSFRLTGRPVDPGTDRPAPGPAPAPYGHDPAQPVGDGAFEQKPVLGRGVVPLVVAGAVAAAAVGIYTSRADDAPAEESVAPPPPQDFVADAVSSDTVRLTWEPAERADSYTAFVIDPATKEDPEPRATSVVDDIPGDQGQYDVGERAPGAEHCFQLAAVRDDTASARTDPRCVTTPQVAAPGALAPPTDVRAERSGDTVLVSWVDASGGAADHVVTRGDTVVTQVTAPVTQAEVPATDADDCFAVRAISGDVESEPSGEACVDATPDEAGGEEGGGAAAGGGGLPVDGAAPASGSAPGTLGVIAVPTQRGFADVDDPRGERLAADYRAELRAQGIEAGVLLSTEYPDLDPPLREPSYLVYIPGFDSAEAVTTECERLGLTCQAFAPGAPQVAAPGASTGGP